MRSTNESHSPKIPPLPKRLSNEKKLTARSNTVVSVSRIWGVNELCIVPNSEEKNDLAKFLDLEPDLTVRRDIKTS